MAARAEQKRGNGGKKAGIAKFHEHAIAISQDKNEDGTSAAVTAVIVGGGPAGMICALALMHLGFRVIVCEEQAAFTEREPAPGQAKGPTEPILLSPETVYLLQEWGMSKRDDKGCICPDMGPAARKIPYLDLRSLSGRLLRREPNDCYAMRAQDLCYQIHQVLTRKSMENAKQVKTGHYEAKHEASYEIKCGARVLDVVDISWGVAVYLSNGHQVAGDILLGCDGVESIVRDYVTKFNPNARDRIQLTGFTQWQGALDDEAGTYKWFDDAVHLFLSAQCSCLVYRLPNNVLNWAMMRPTAMEGQGNKLQEWKTMMANWGVNDDGSVSIPHEEMMGLRSAFDLFDADKSGNLDFDEVRTAMEQCGMTLTEKELREMADQIDKDGTGTFDFAEFSELVKLLLIRLRQAHDANDTVEEMTQVLEELEEEIKLKYTEQKRLTAKVFEMRKGGAQGKLQLEDRLNAIPDQISEIRQQIKDARDNLDRATAIQAKSTQNDALEYETAKSSLGIWLRTTNSSKLLQRVVLSTQNPQRTMCVERGGILSLNAGRVCICGQAAHPVGPGTFVSGNECVLDAKELVNAINAHHLPDGLPHALADYSKARASSAAYATMASRETLRMYSTAGIDWDYLSEDELSSILHLPLVANVPVPSVEEEDKRKWKSSTVI